METKETGAYIRALSKVSRAITSNMFLKDVLKLIVTVTADAMGAHICSLMLVDEKTGELVIRATQSMSELYNTKPPLKVGEGIAGKAIMERRAIAVKNVRNEKEYKFKDIAKKEGLCSLLSVPLEVKDKVIGVINCYTPKPHEFSELEINMVTSIAHQAAVVIENAELVMKSEAIKEELASRKLVERAKGILMRDKSLTEEDAHKRLLRHSMETRKSLREVAEAIILASQIKR